MTTKCSRHKSFGNLDLNINQKDNKIRNNLDTNNTRTDVRWFPIIFCRNSRSLASKKILETWNFGAFFHND